MAASSFNATTGAPEYADADAPDVAVNPTEVAAFAATVGTRLIGDNAAMIAYGYAREGLLWWDTDNDSEYRHNGTTWQLVYAADSSVSPTLGSGWTVSANVLKRRSGIAFLDFNASRSANAAVGAVVVSIPAGYRASSPNIYAQAWGLAGANNTIQSFYDVGAHQIKINQAVASGQAIALSMCWRIDS